MRRQLLIGPGRNGKSVLIKLVEALVGHENASHASLQELLGDRFASADLYCKLVNDYADLEADKLINTGKFKTLVSGDSIRAQKKHQQAFSFRNYAKLIFSTNKIPESEDKSYAYYRRWVILSFNRVFEGEDEDTGLMHKLTTDEHELAGLLNLALKGLKKLIKEGGFKDVSVEKIKQHWYRRALRS
jgi:putative DNA primase/helicase